MKIMIEVEPENVFEREYILYWIKQQIKLLMPMRFKIKKVSVEVLE